MLNSEDIYLIDIHNFLPIIWAVFKSLCNEPFKTSCKIGYYNNDKQHDQDVKREYRIHFVSE